MARRSSGDSNRELIHNLQANGIIKDPRVADAMMAVDRSNYCKKNPYMDSPQSIGHSVNISAPHMHAHTLEILSKHLKEGKRALDVGSGSGYLTACMAMLVGESGVAVGIELIDELVNSSLDNLKKAPVTTHMLETGMLKIVVGDGYLGHKPQGPYDAIQVGAATPEIPQALVEQLRPGGRLVVPVGPEGGNQELMQIDRKEDGSVVQTKLMSVRFGSLTINRKQWPASLFK